MVATTEGLGVEQATQPYLPGERGRPTIESKEKGRLPHRILPHHR